MYDPVLQNARKPKGYDGEKTLERMNEHHAPLVKWGLSYLNILQNAKILDIGCGGGATIGELLNRYENSIVDGVDFSEKSVEMSKNFNAKFLGTRCEINQGDAANLPYENESYDAVTAVETVYFWQPVEKAFSEVFRVLKRDGVFMILNEISDPQSQWKDKIKGMNIYTPQQLCDILKSIGFVNVEFYQGERENICVIAKK